MNAPDPTPDPDRCWQPPSSASWPREPRKTEPVRLGSLLILYSLIAVFLAGCAMLVAAALGAQ